MAYRPQFAYPVPDTKCMEMRGHYSYDSTNTPSLVGNLAAGARTGRIPLPLDRDADFYLLAIQQLSAGAGIHSAQNIQVRIEDPWTNPLSDSGNSNESTNFQFTKLFSAWDGAGFITLDGGEQGIYCPRGSVLNLYLYNPTASSIQLSQVILTLHGRKRYTEPCA